MHTFFNPDREGWLWKQGTKTTCSITCFFVLFVFCLFFFFGCCISFLLVFRLVRLLYLLDFVLMVTWPQWLCPLGRWPLQIVEETLVHLERQLSVLLWIHHRQGTERNYSAGKYSGMKECHWPTHPWTSIAITLRFKLDNQVREVPDRNKPNCFELYATGGNDFIKGTRSSGM